MDGDDVIYTRRRVRDLIRALLRSDTVRTFVWLYYLWFIAGSVHLVFFARPLKLLEESMGGLYTAWAWLPLIAAPTALIGLALRHGGSPADDIRGPLLRKDFLGLWMQAGGHTAMTLVLAVYVASVFYGADVGQPTPSAYWLSAYFISCAILAAQCGYKIVLGMRMSR